METVTNNSDIEDRHQFGTSSHRSLHEVRRSLSGSNSRVPRQRPDMKRGKRVRFAETEADCPVVGKPNPYALPAKEHLPPTFEEPKTSEYAFYKKLRKDAGGSFNSYTRKEQDTSEANNPVRELSNTRNPVKSDDQKRSLMPVAMVTPIKVRSPQLSRPSQSLPGESRNSGAQKNNVEVFAAKRKKLLHWALESSSSDISRCHSKGYDLVSVLLHRLIPESNETAGMTCAAQKTKHPVVTTKSQLLAPEELPESSSSHVNFVRPFAKHCIENCLSNCWSNQFRETIFTQLDTENSGSPLAQKANKFHLKCQKRYSDDCTDDKRHRSLQIMRESDFDLDFTDDRKLRSLQIARESDFDLDFTDDRKLRSLQIARESDYDMDYLDRKELFSGCGHPSLKQSGSDFSVRENPHSFWDYSEKPFGFSNKSSSKALDELNDLNEPLLRSEQCAHFLGYHDYDSGNEQYFSCNSPITVLNWGPTSSTLSEDYTWTTSSLEYSATEHQSSSVFAICEGPDFPLLDSYSESYPLPGFGRGQINGNRNCQVAISDHFLPMNISFNSPHYLSLTENIEMSGDYINRGVLHSPCGKIRFMSMGFRDPISPNLEKLQLPSGVNFNFETKGSSAIYAVEEYPLSGQSDLQLVAKGTKGLYSSSHMGAMNDMCLEGLSLEAAFCHNDDDILRTHDYSPVGFKFSLNTEMVYPRLLDKSSWVEPLETSHYYWG
ncbi:hypothetical protein MKX01_039688 [Papaver californicum]|nr:hypothetical protein MKX01_039688 [Papaver californicum]